MPMRFERYGSSHHLVIESADDLREVLTLDEALWVATNAPTATLHADRRLLELLDSDRNGRVTCRELREAIRWTLDTLSDPSGLSAGDDVLRPACIDQATPDGARIGESVRKMLDRFGQGDCDEVSLAEVRRIKSDVEARPVSEAGVVLPAAAEDSEVRDVLEDILATVGGVSHPSGQMGVDEARLTEFLDAGRSILRWWEEGEIPSDGEPTAIMPLGEQTATAYAALGVVRAKLDQYFAQCEAVALDESFQQRMGWTEAELASLDFDDPAVIEDVLQQAPLAKARSDRTLTIDESVNPYYRESLKVFADVSAAAALGRDVTQLTAADWGEVKRFYQAHHEWMVRKPVSPVEQLGAARLRECTAGAMADAIRGLIDESGRTALVLENIRLAEKLLVFQANLLRVANNFVSFPHLYNPAARAMFETGTLVMDGRRFNVAVRTDSRSADGELVKSANMLLLYVQVSPAGQEPYEVAVPVTSAGKGSLAVGKRGVFQDVWGNECVARVVGIVDNPVSLREAVVAPFRRLWKMITGKIESFASEGEKKLDTTTEGRLNEIVPGPGAQSGKTPADQPTPSASGKPEPAQRSAMATGGMLAGAGVAVAALGSSLAYIARTVSQTHWLAIVISILAAVALVAIPTLIMAIIKLRRRDLRAVLEASGWGINARMRLTRKQRKFFTRRPERPRRRHWSDWFRPWRWRRS